MRKHTFIKRSGLFTVLSALLFIFACGKLGNVDQGRVIEFDKEKGTVTLIRDFNADPNNPDYTHLPPFTYEMPKDPSEIGALPKAGKRMELDTEKNQIIIFDTATQNFKTIDYKVIDHKENVAKNNPLVYDEATEVSKSFPIIDKENKTITIYSGRQKILITFSLPDEYFALPDDTWDSGDEVRIYYKEEGKARRFMNISKTDIFKK
ncbi:MAG: DUF4881 domain-containing protein [Desulfobacterium sp.]|nr:DUF4881 domain-containing protein [Desulfobacterium sp.]MBU4035289.1 DUF4881 domain-containing protein [Pseudomonadota bacterium]